MVYKYRKLKISDYLKKTFFKSLVHPELLILRKKSKGEGKALRKLKKLKREKVFLLKALSFGFSCTLKDFDYVIQLPCKHRDFRKVLPFYNFKRFNDLFYNAVYGLNFSYLLNGPYEIESLKNSFAYTEEFIFAGRYGFLNLENLYIDLYYSLYFDMQDFFIFKSKIKENILSVNFSNVFTTLKKKKKLRVFDSYLNAFDYVTNLERVSQENEFFGKYIQNQWQDRDLIKLKNFKQNLINVFVKKCNISTYSKEYLNFFENMLSLNLESIYDQFLLKALHFFKKIYYLVFKNVNINFFFSFWTYLKNINLQDLYLVFKLVMPFFYTTDRFNLFDSCSNNFSLKLIKNPRLFFKQFFFKNFFLKKKVLKGFYYKFYTEHKRFVYSRVLKNFYVSLKTFPHFFFDKIRKSLVSSCRKIFSLSLNFYKKGFVFPYLFFNSNEDSNLDFSPLLFLLIKMLKPHFHSLLFKNKKYLKTLRRNRISNYFRMRFYRLATLANLFINERMWYKMRRNLKIRTTSDVYITKLPQIKFENYYISKIRSLSSFCSRDGLRTIPRLIRNTKKRAFKKNRDIYSYLATLARVYNFVNERNDPALTTLFIDCVDELIINARKSLFYRLSLVLGKISTSVLKLGGLGPLGNDWFEKAYKPLWLNLNYNFRLNFKEILKELKAQGRKRAILLRRKRILKAKRIYGRKWQQRRKTWNNSWKYHSRRVLWRK